MFFDLSLTLSATQRTQRRIAEKRPRILFWCLRPRQRNNIQVLEESFQEKQFEFLQRNFLNKLKYNFRKVANYQNIYFPDFLKERKNLTGVIHVEKGSFFSGNRKTNEVCRENHCGTKGIKKCESFRKQKTSLKKIRCVSSLGYLSAVTPYICIIHISVSRNLPHFYKC